MDMCESCASKWPGDFEGVASVLGVALTVAGVKEKCMYSVNTEITQLCISSAFFPFLTSVGLSRSQEPLQQVCMRLTIFEMCLVQQMRSTFLEPFTAQERTGNHQEYLFKK